MKKLTIILTVLAAAVIAGCQPHQLDNTRSKSNLEMQITASAESIVLDESNPDAVALTVNWTPAHDYGDDYITTYEYSIDVTTSKAAPIKEYEDEGIFTRSYTHGELQTMLTGHFDVASRKKCLLRLGVTATFSGPRVVINDQSSVIVEVKTYGPRQFAADKVFIGGTAIGADAIELAPKTSGVYVYQAALQAGKFNFPVEYDEEESLIVPEGDKDTAIDGKDQPAAVTDPTSTAGWTVSKSDNYRVTINFNTKTVSAIPTSEIFEVDKIFLAGSAIGEEQVEVAATLEDPSVFAFRDELQAGELYLPVEFDGSVNFAIVPAGDTHDISDGQTLEFGQALASQAAGKKYWTIPSAGVYRIVVNTLTRKVTIYSPATDLPNKKVSYNNTVDSINPYEQEVKDELWMWGGFNAMDKDSDQLAGFQKKYTLKQSLANPYIFVYYGEELPRKSGNYNSKNAETGATNGAAWLTFLVSNIQNNVFAFGSTADAKRNDHTGTVEPQLGETVDAIGGQGDHRYSYFVIPEGANYVIVDISQMSDDVTPANNTAVNATVKFEKR